MPSLHVIIRAFRCMSAHIRILHIKARKGGGHTHTHRPSSILTRELINWAAAVMDRRRRRYIQRARILPRSLPSLPFCSFHMKRKEHPAANNTRASHSLFFLSFPFFFAVASIQWLSCKVLSCSRIRQTGIEKSETS